MEREKIIEFLKSELANGGVPAKLLQERACAAGLIEAGRLIWKAKAWRNAARRLGVQHLQKEGGWIWKLIKPLVQKALAVSEASQAPVAPPAPTEISPAGADAPVPELRIFNPLPDAPASDPKALAAERRRIGELLMRDHPEVMRKAVSDAKIRVAKYLQTGDLADLCPAGH